MFTKRNLMWAGVAILLLGALGGLWTIHDTVRVSFTADEIQGRINKQLEREFPIKGAPGLLVRTVAAKGATVQLQDGQVIVLADAEGTLRTGRKFTITAFAVGIPSYNSGEFYFTPDRVEVQQFAYEGSTPTEIFSRFARRLPGERTRQFAENRASKVEEWLSAIAESAAVHVLERKPVYRLKEDVKGVLLKATLQTVAIEQDRLVVTFNVWQITLWAIAGVVCLLLALALGVALRRYPYLQLPFLWIDPK